jgi:hypothetical protein
MDRFAELGQHATRTSQFNQRDYMQAYRDNDLAKPPAARTFTTEDYGHLMDGTCAGVTLKWMQEKLGGSGATSALRPKDFSDALSAGRREKLMRSVADVALDHTRNDVDLDALFEKNHLELTSMDDYNRKDKDASNLPYTDLARTFEKVCTALENGQGVLMRTSVMDQESGLKKGHHATGLYKSRSGKLHFFDPNAGAFEVHDAGKFINDWIASYPKVKSEVTMSHQRDGFFQCTAKKKLMRSMMLGKRCSSIKPSAASSTDRHPD